MSDVRYGWTEIIDGGDVLYTYDTPEEAAREAADFFVEYGGKRDEIEILEIRQVGVVRRKIETILDSQAPIDANG